MSALLRGELLKLRTTRTFSVLVGTALSLSLLLVTLIATTGSGAVTGDDARSKLLAGDVSGIVILLLGVIGMSGEWRHKTITGTVLASPNRARLLAAKVLSHSIAGVLLSLIVTTATIAAGTLIMSGRGEATLDAAQLADLLWRSLTVAAVLGALGVCVGALVRNQTVAVVGVIVIAAVLEVALMDNLPEVGRFGPFNGAPNGILGGVGAPKDEVLSLGAAVAVSIGWVGAAFTTAATLLRRRDLV
jgi:ABC-2 type transport system permease protein